MRYSAPPASSEKKAPPLPMGVVPAFQKGAQGLVSIAVVSFCTEAIGSYIDGVDHIISARPADDCGGL